MILSTRKASSTLGFLRRNLRFCPPSCAQQYSLHLPCPLCFRILRYSLGPLPAKWHWQSRKHPEMCSSPRQPKLQRPHHWMCHQHAERPESRWKPQRLTLFCKIIIIIDNFYIALFSGVPKLTALKAVRGLTPAIPANEFLTPVNSKRLIKPRNPTDFKTTNIEW